MIAVKFSLRNILLLLTMLCALTFFTLAMVSHYYSQRHFLLDNTHEANTMYARKMADILDIYLQDAQQVLAFSARILQDHYAENMTTAIEAARLIEQNRYFNSVVMADTSGVVIASAPARLNLNGRQLNTTGAKQSLAEQKPLISAPFYSAVGNYIISISTPVFDKQNTFLGFISGTLHLQRGNILSELLAHHYTSETHRIYIYNSNKILIYHSNPEFIGKTLTEFSNERDTPSFFQQNTAKAQSKVANWQVAVERTEASLREELFSQVIATTRYLIPVSIIAGLVIWWLGARLSAPLKQLVRVSNDLALSPNRANFRNISSPITEIQLLKQALIRRAGDIQQKISSLDKASQTDPLTNIANRRGLEVYAATICDNVSSFALLAIDIDHFKSVNDTFGHNYGDLVLQRLAEILSQNTRAEDLVCRIGGEEFLIITEHREGHTKELAERIRKTVAQTDFGLASSITISVGVALWQVQANSVMEAVKDADIALYQAKHNGRNQVVFNQAIS